MKKIVDWYLRLNETKRVIFILVIIGFFASLVSLFFLLIPNSAWNGLPLGIILGTIIEIICYVFIVYSTKNILSLGNGKKGSVALAILMMLGRILLYAGGLVIAAFCQFKWNFRFLNTFAVFGAYLPLYIVLIVRGLRKKKADKK